MKETAFKFNVQQICTENNSEVKFKAWMEKELGKDEQKIRAARAAFIAQGKHEQQIYLFNYLKKTVKARAAGQSKPKEKNESK